MELISEITNQLVEKREHPDFGAGDTINVHYKILEGNKERVQIFRGVVIQRRGKGLTETFTVRKISKSIGVERVFPYHSPKIEKITVEKYGKVRRARLFYLRKSKGSTIKIKPKIVTKS